MTDLSKTNNIVQNVQIAPVNNASAGYTPSQYINFRVGKGQMSQWLTNSSYMTFDIAIPAITLAGNTAANGVSAYIRDANMIFNQVEVLYAGNKIYSNVFNCETNMIKYLKYGDSYLDSNFNTFTTKKMISEGTAHLTTPAGAGTIAATTIANVIIPINQLCPLFEDISSDGFALGSLTEQLEFRFYVANPSQFLSFYGNDISSAASTTNITPASSSGDFVTYWTNNAAAHTAITYPTTCTISNPQLNCYYFIPNDDFANYIQSVNGPGGKGTIYRYALWQLNTRNHTMAANTNSNLPFSVVTENTKALLVYMHTTGRTPSVTTRPSMSNVYTMFGNNLVPKQPLSGNTYTNPGQYKFIVDDVYDMLDTYYSTTNSELTRSYTYGAETTASAFNNSSGFVLVAGNYVNDVDELGSNSNAWNSQYQLLFTSGTTMPSNTAQTIVFGVKSEYGLIIKDNSVQTYNL